MANNSITTSDGTQMFVGDFVRFPNPTTSTHAKLCGVLAAFTGTTVTINVPTASAAGGYTLYTKIVPSTCEVVSAANPANAASHRT